MTAAAADLGVSQPAVSKLLRNLETHTGARLLERSSRAMRPTAQGLALYEAAGDALAAIDAAIEGVRSDAGAINGSLRLHGPTCVGERHLHSIVMSFQDKHPTVAVELTLENRSVDLIHENVDLAVRMGRPTDQNLILRRIGFSKRSLSRRPTISPAADLFVAADPYAITTSSSRTPLFEEETSAFARKIRRRRSPFDQS